MCRQSDKTFVRHQLAAIKLGIATRTYNEERKVRRNIIYVFVLSFA